MSSSPKTEAARACGSVKLFDPARPTAAFGQTTYSIASRRQSPTNLEAFRRMLKLFSRAVSRDHTATVALAALAFIAMAAPVNGQECRDQSQPHPAYVAEDGLRLAVIRAGLIRQQNPLRPLSTEPLSIWQVTVNGQPGFLRLAAPGVLQELPSLTELEYVNSAPVAWSPLPPEAPPEIRVVTAKGATVGPLRFAGCEQRSRIPPPKSAESSSSAKDRASVRKPVAPAVRLPQGAISE